MEYSLLKEINKKSLAGYLQNRPTPPNFWPDFFPPKTTPFLTYESLIGSKGNPVAADIVAYNASAPIKKRKVVSKLTGDIPAIRVKRDMKETDINTYNVLKAMATPDQKAILDLVFNDVDFVYDSVQARMEWLALKILSYPYLTLSKSTNDGIVTEAAIDFGMPSTNKKYAAVVWSATASTTTPITDFINVVAAASALGVSLKYALMNTTQWGQFAASAETQNYTIGSVYGGNRIKLTPTLAQANDMLASRGLPEIIIIDKTVTIETGEGVQSNVKPWTTNYVTFIPDLAVGNMNFGPIAEETNPPKQAVQVKQNNVLISKFSDVDPVTEWTKGETNAFPSWHRVDECFSLLTTSASAWA